MILHWILIPIISSAIITGGLLRAQVGDDNRAIQDFNFVIEMEPDNMMAIFNRGLLLDQTGDYKGAIKDYSTVINEYPKFFAGLSVQSAGT